MKDFPKLYQENYDWFMSKDENAVYSRLLMLKQRGPDLTRTYDADWWAEFYAAQDAYANLRIKHYDGKRKRPRKDSGINRGKRTVFYRTSGSIRSPMGVDRKEGRRKASQVGVLPTHRRAS